MVYVYTGGNLHRWNMRVFAGVSYYLVLSVNAAGFFKILSSMPCTDVCSRALIDLFNFFVIDHLLRDGHRNETLPNDHECRILRQSLRQPLLYRETIGDFLADFCDPDETFDLTVMTLNELP